MLTVWKLHNNRLQWGHVFLIDLCVAKHHREPYVCQIQVVTTCQFQMFVLHSRNFGNNKDLDINCIPSSYWSQIHSNHFPQGWICCLCPKVVTVSHSFVESFKPNACATCVLTKDVWLAVSKSTLILAYPSLLLGLVQFAKHHYCCFLCALCCPLTQHSLIHFLTLHLPWGFGTTNRRMMFRAL